MKKKDEYFESSSMKNLWLEWLLSGELSSNVIKDVVFIIELA